jgi:hypothetical protein
MQPDVLSIVWVNCCCPGARWAGLSRPMEFPENFRLFPLLWTDGVSWRPRKPLAIYLSLDGWSFAASPKTSAHLPGSFLILFPFFLFSIQSYLTRFLFATDAFMLQIDGERHMIWLPFSSTRFLFGTDAAPALI